ncbi:MAG: DUF3014 domain-containing protein [Methylococcales bacterium]|nr:DUF3014 domain-containing protein [Methylococcales bacterium]
MGRYDHRRNKKFSGVNPAVVVVLIILAGVGGFYFARQQSDSLEEPGPQALAIPPLEEKGADVEAKKTVTDNLEELQQEEEQIVLPTLDASDGLFRQNMVQVSPMLGQWLSTDQLIKKYVVIANDFSQGLRLEKHMRFLKPDLPFVADQDDAGLFIATKSYQRYNKLAAAINSMDAQATLAVYRKFRPLLLQVFAGFSYPEQYQLEDIFTKAAAEILAAPIIYERIALIKPTVNYKFADPKLEALSPISKQMIRLGPENTRIIQDKVRILVDGLVKE